MSAPEFRIEPWGEDDLPLLEKLMGDPAMTENLGGPESPEKIVERQQRYERLPGTGQGRMFKIVQTATGESVGSVGYWERESSEGRVYETGWMVLPPFQGRGVAASATSQVIERAKAERKHRFLYAYPSVDNAPSNAICRKLGFTLVDVSEYEYPQGSGKIMSCNDWRLDLLEVTSIARMRELRPGVWHWQSQHPGWDAEQPWPELVSSYGVELGDDFVLFDPLSVPDELRERATAVVLTAPYHERDARQLGLPVHTPPADTWQDWVEKFGIDPERVRGMESEDLAWLRAGEGEGHFHDPGAWPFGMTAYAGREDNDLILWLPSINAIVTGDSLSDFGEGLDVQLGGRKHVTRDDVVRRLRPLLDLPVELVLPAHGESTDRAGLERVLA